MSIIGRVKEKLISDGASLVGFADLRGLDRNIRKDFKLGISIGFALDPDIIHDVKNGPTMGYYNEYIRANKKLDGLSETISGFLNKHGYKTDHWGATEDREYGHYMTALPHKTTATLAGLGWIGKCALLVTEEYGSALRLTTVLTDIEDKVENKSIRESNCGNCSVCVSLCPGKAPKGINWYRGLDREDFFNPDLCREAAIKMAKKRTGIEKVFCGICIANCPYTKKYIARMKKAG